VEKIKKFDVPHFFLNHSFEEIVRKNIAGPDRQQMTIWRMRVACWLPEATNTFLEYVILIAFPLQESLYERASLLHYMYIAYLVPVSYCYKQVSY